MVNLLKTAMLAGIIAFFATLMSCTNETVLDTTMEPPHKISGSIDINNLPCTIEIDGKKITFESFNPDTLETIQTKAAWSQTYYFANPKMVQLSDKIKKVIFKNCGPYQGTFIASDFRFTGSISIPSNAITGKILVPNPCGFKNSEQDLGINWNMESTPTGGVALAFTYYTLRVEYNMLGQRIGHVYPVDGNTIRVPYQFYIE